MKLLTLTGPRAKVKCYGADDVREGVAIMWKEGVDVSITGNSTKRVSNTQFAGTYKKERVLAGKPYFSVASGGGTGRTLHPADNMAAGHFIRYSELIQWVICTRALSSLVLHPFLLT